MGKHGLTVEPLPFSYISHDPGPLLFDGIYAATLESLVQTLGKASREEALLVSDLSLGAWRGHEIARTLYAQLELPFPAPSCLPISVVFQKWRWQLLWL